MIWHWPKTRPSNPTQILKNNLTLLARRRRRVKIHRCTKLREPLAFESRTSGLRIDISRRPIPHRRPSSSLRVAAAAIRSAWLSSSSLEIVAGIQRSAIFYPHDIGGHLIPYQIPSSSLELIGGHMILSEATLVVIRSIHRSVTIDEVL